MTASTPPENRKKRRGLVLIIAGGFGLLVLVGLVVQTAFQNPPSPEATVEPSPTTTAELTPAGPPDYASLGGLWIRPADEMTMVYAPPGTFEMGSDDSDVVYALQQCYPYGASCDSDWFVNELPAHDVTLSGFWIDRIEVTNAHYQRCLAAGMCGEATCGDDQDPAGPDHPVTCVTFEQAQAYCEWVGARLPTEAEWEYAARGPEPQAFPWGHAFDGARLNYCDTHCEFAWADLTTDDGYARTAPAGSFPGGSSWCGALDMAGNVHEWVADWYAEDYYALSPSLNPTGPASGEYRILRGGSWGAVPGCVRTASRGLPLPGMTAPTIGFRCAYTVD